MTTKMVVSECYITNNSVSMGLLQTSNIKCPFLTINMLLFIINFKETVRFYTAVHHLFRLRYLDSDFYSVTHKTGNYLRLSQRLAPKS